MLIEYLGSAKGYVSPLFDTGFVWEGPGDVREVPDHLAVRMLRNSPNFYRDAAAPRSQDDEVLPVPPKAAGVLDTTLIPDDGDMKPLRIASEKALRQHCRDQGLKIPAKATRLGILGVLASMAEFQEMLSPHLRPEALVPRLADAAKQGRGANLTASEVRTLLGVREPPPPPPEPDEAALDAPELASGDAVDAPDPDPAPPPPPEPDDDADDDDDDGGLY